MHSLGNLSFFHTSAQTWTVCRLAQRQKMCYLILTPWKNTSGHMKKKNVYDLFWLNTKKSKNKIFWVTSSQNRTKRLCIQSTKEGFSSVCAVSVLLVHSVCKVNYHYVRSLLSGKAAGFLRWHHHLMSQIQRPTLFRPISKLQWTTGSEVHSLHVTTSESLFKNSKDGSFPRHMQGINKLW